MLFNFLLLVITLFEVSRVLRQVLKYNVFHHLYVFTHDTLELLYFDAVWLFNFAIVYIIALIAFLVG